MHCAKSSLNESADDDIIAVCSSSMFPYSRSQSLVDTGMIHKHLEATKSISFNMCSYGQCCNVISTDKGSHHTLKLGAHTLLWMFFLVLTFFGLNPSCPSRWNTASDPKTTLFPSSGTLISWGGRMTSQRSATFTSLVSYTTSKCASSSPTTSTHTVVSLYTVPPPALTALLIVTRMSSLYRVWPCAANSSYVYYGSWFILHHV